MRTVRILYLACASVAMFSAHPVFAQAKHDVVLHFHRAGDTTSIRNVAVTLDYAAIDAGKTDAAGNARVPNFPDGQHTVEAIAAGYAYLIEEFNSGPDVAQPIDFEMVPAGPAANKATVKPPAKPR